MGIVCDAMISHERQEQRAEVGSRMLKSSPALAGVRFRQYIPSAQWPSRAGKSWSTSEECLARTKRHVWAVVAAEEANTRSSLPMCAWERDTKSDRRARQGGRVGLHMDWDCTEIYEMPIMA